ncbi:hypothetical protein GGU10DRAFT_370441 [Lentinula aff. detonsa]|uniref:Uncharacterized protein n=1 Tax=Lentinula aff. detonsa TaxID=2804958 RepID=A0AA38KM87_9AGAR|nr:hypothetical protein GGU10DRAFT_370441 [Lentinula aff. detonsa]
MQVVNGLYQRFIHEASISQVADKFNEVTYNRKDGAKVMFSELKRWAVCMPIPPDLYTFKRRILLLVPPAMCKDMTRIEKVSEGIMQMHGLILNRRLRKLRKDTHGEIEIGPQSVSRLSINDDILSQIMNRSGRTTAPGRKAIPRMMAHHRGNLLGNEGRALTAENTTTTEGAHYANSRGLELNQINNNVRNCTV